MGGIAPLHGSCSCGRNEYVVHLPDNLSRLSSTDLAQVYFDSGSANRRHQAAPLTAWLRVPLAWYQSATYAYYPDETHSSIRRTFTSPAVTASDTTMVRRQFCGYCGTQLSRWAEDTRRDAEFIALTLGSLVGEDLDRLVGLGLLPEEEDDDDDDDDENYSESYGGDQRGKEQAEEEGPSSDVARTEPAQERSVDLVRGFPWFEAMVTDSRLGRVRRQKGGHVSRDGRTRVEWEVVELDGAAGEGREEEQRGTKRKGEAEGEDVQMGSA
ncbi:MAG: hypothetical protein M1821_001371 [Bathelium mastoideum]|nr:MAG: hypothetical protein M1821_001371 [Bathelium mastoideum]